jgi:hypothetical protein
MAIEKSNGDLYITQMNINKSPSFQYLIKWLCDIMK